MVLYLSKHPRNLCHEYLNYFVYSVALYCWALPSSRKYHTLNNTEVDFVLDSLCTGYSVFYASTNVVARGIMFTECSCVRSCMSL